jgi:hypothetical protein
MPQLNAREASSMPCMMQMLADSFCKESLADRCPICNSSKRIKQHDAYQAACMQGG